MTTAEYFSTPETAQPTELAFGVLRVADAPFTPHQRMVGDLHLALAPYVRAQTLGEVWLAPCDVVLDEDRALVVQPDLLFVAHARRDIVRERVYGPPDLVIEVLSPGPRVGRVEEKLAWYGMYGVRECWLVHHARGAVEVVSWSGGVPAHSTYERHEAVRSGVLPGFDLSLDAISTWYLP